MNAETKKEGSYDDSIGNDFRANPNPPTNTSTRLLPPEDQPAVSTFVGPLQSLLTQLLESRGASETSTALTPTPTNATNLLMPLRTGAASSVHEGETKNAPSSYPHPPGAQCEPGKITHQSFQPVSEPTFPQRDLLPQHDQYTYNTPQENTTTSTTSEHLAPNQSQPCRPEQERVHAFEQWPQHHDNGHQDDVVRELKRILAAEPAREQVAVLLQRQGYLPQAQPSTPVSTAATSPVTEPHHTTFPPTSGDPCLSWLVASLQSILTSPQRHVLLEAISHIAPDLLQTSNLSIRPEQQHQQGAVELTNGFGQSSAASVCNEPKPSLSVQARTSRLDGKNREETRQMHSAHHGFSHDKLPRGAGNNNLLLDSDPAVPPQQKVEKPSAQPAKCSPVPRRGPSSTGDCVHGSGTERSTTEVTPKAQAPTDCKDAYCSKAAAENRSHEDENDDNDNESIPEPPLRKRREYRHEPFPRKLYRMLMEAEERGHDDIVSFSTSGRAFQVHKPEEFVEIVIPRYFNHNHLSSFRRQLSMYCFQRQSSDEKIYIYSHKYFRRGYPDLCDLVLNRKDQKELDKEKICSK